jgi:uncharacterized membrane protein (DUF2068 family)
MMSSSIKIDAHTAEKSLLRAVATFEFMKGIFVFMIGLVAILLVHRDAWVLAESLLAIFHISTDRRSAQMFLDFADNLTDARLWSIAELAFTYTTLRFAEGYGLWRQRTWAEWLAFGSGMLLLPLEIRALFHAVTFLRCAILVINVAIVVYMYILLRAGRRERRQLLAMNGEVSGSMSK